MKTTVDLPEDVLLRAKVTAAERRTTLRELVIAGLTYVTATPPEDAQAKRKSDLRRLLKAMRAANTEPMRPLPRENLYDR